MYHVDFSLKGSFGGERRIGHEDLRCFILLTTELERSFLQVERRDSSRTGRECVSVVSASVGRMPLKYLLA